MKPKHASKTLNFKTLNAWNLFLWFGRHHSFLFAFFLSGSRFPPHIIPTQTTLFVSLARVYIYTHTHTHTIERGFVRIESSFFVLFLPKGSSKEKKRAETYSVVLLRTFIERSAFVKTTRRNFGLKEEEEEEDPIASEKNNAL